MTPTAIGYDEVTERALLALELGSLDEPLPELSLPSPHFVCLLAADFSARSDERISRLAEVLAAAGCSYFVCWGPGCERAHDLIDEVLLARDPAPTDDSIVMTSWHADEPLDEALFSFLRVSWPAQDYFDGTRAALAVTLDDPELARRVRAALAAPVEFVARVAEST